MVRSMVGFALGEKFGLVWICVIGDCVAHSVMMVCVCVCECVFACTNSALARIDNRESVAKQ